MTDKFSPKLILLVISVGQILFIYSSSIFENWSLFFMSLFAMAFVFGQVPINDIILSRYVPDRKRAKILSIKYVLNLSAGASVLPICSLMMQNGFEMRQIFALMSFFAVFIFLAAMLLPNQAASERLDLTTSLSSFNYICAVLRLDLLDCEPPFLTDLPMEYLEQNSGDFL